MRIMDHMTRYLGEMLGHGVGVAPWHYECCRLAKLGADRAEDVG